MTIVHYLPRSRHGTARPAVTATPPPLPLAVSGDAGVAAEPDGITGQTLSWPGGLRLPAAGQRPVWFWPATGQVVPIGGLPRQSSGYQFIRATGGWAVQAGPGAQAGCGGCAGPRRAVYFLADHAQAVTQVGLADAVAPGAAPLEAAMLTGRKIKNRRRAGLLAGAAAVVVAAVAGVPALTSGSWTSKILGFVALILASVNIFGGFIVTQRMLQMFKKKKT